MKQIDDNLTAAIGMVANSKHKRRRKALKEPTKADLEQPWKMVVEPDGRVKMVKC